MWSGSNSRLRLTTNPLAAAHFALASQRQPLQPLLPPTSGCLKQKKKFPQHCSNTSSATKQQLQQQNIRLEEEKNEIEKNVKL